ncbi:hypothetical protein [Alienimonas chondri]|uniref:DUF2946 domain-containing protein n=1 Tax=Alienimonas chondri TaxID=2681879 RepID=A0ABX1VEY8_9PLAN|nr:hypothetical protein [Alienimonas chondri]NNJ26664.1 hypothetical protein [Alienimonas chondri]
MRFGWSRGAATPVFVTLGALVAYLTAVTAPAWHAHDHAGHACCGAHQSVEAETPSACGHDHGHAHHGHSHHGHAHHGPCESEESERTAGEEPGSSHDHEGGSDHDCPVCELIATAATPVTPPVVMDVCAAPPTLAAPAAPDRRAVFLRTQNARGPPRG